MGDPIFLEHLILDSIYSGVCVVCTYSHDYCTQTLKSSNQNAISIGYDILIGCFSRTSIKLILESFMTVKPEL